MLWMLLAAGVPTYLTCSLDQEGEPLRVELVANEPEQKAVISLPTGRVVTRTAIFTPTEVRIPDEESTWVVDRVGLEFQRRVQIGTHRSVHKGRCEVKPAPAKRAF